MKKKLILVLSFLLTFILFACANNTIKTNTSVESGEKVYKIGAIQLVQHPALDSSYKGFIDYLNEKNVKYSVDYQNASGEQSACITIAEKFSNDNLDLCYAIATPAAQSLLSYINTVPIVASAVTDPAASKLCNDNKKPGGNLTAASDLTPVDAQFDLLKELIPDAKKVGVLYSSAEANSKIQADIAREAGKKRGLEVIDYTVVSSADIQTVVEGMVGKVDVIYVPTDNTVSAGFDMVATIANENKIPTIVGEGAMVDKGGLATYGIDYYQLGKLAGEIAYDILVNGKNAGEIPVKYLDSNMCERKINEDVAKLLGLNIK